MGPRVLAEDRLARPWHGKRLRARPTCARPPCRAEARANLQRAYHPRAITQRRRARLPRLPPSRTLPTHAERSASGATRGREGSRHPRAIANAPNSRGAERKRSDPREGGPPTSPRRRERSQLTRSGAQAERPAGGRALDIPAPSRTLPTHAERSASGATRGREGSRHPRAVANAPNSRGAERKRSDPREGGLSTSPRRRERSQLTRSGAQAERPAGGRAPTSPAPSRTLPTHAERSASGATRGREGPRRLCRRGGRVA